MAVNIGDKIITKKAHPCGSSEWTVIRINTNIKIKCLGCGRVVMLALSEFNKRLKSIVED